MTTSEPIISVARGIAHVFNVIALALLLYIAIGLVCEIASRNEDKTRVQGYQQWLMSCRVSNDKGCPKDDLEGKITIASIQLARYESLNSLGVGDRCLTAVVFASLIGHFYEDCNKLRRNEELNKPENKVQLESILSPEWFGYSGLVLQFDQRPKEHLYFFLVLTSAAIGSLIAGFRTSGATTLLDLALGVGAGFAVYLLLRGGNFVFFTHSASIDILNPFTSAAAGLLVGLLKDRVFKLFDAVVKSP